MPGRFSCEVPASHCPPSCSWGDPSLDRRRPTLAQTQSLRRSVTSLAIAGERMAMRRVASSSSSTLRVVIISARGLPNCDFNRFDPQADKSDPFCICEIKGKPGGKITTPVIDDCLTPVWNFESRIKDFAGGDSLVFTVLDKDDFKKDDLLGMAKLTIADLYPRGFDGELPLNDAPDCKAFLRVKVTEESVEQMAELMAVLGPRYKTMPQAQRSELVTRWSEESLLRRRLRRDAELRETAAATRDKVQPSSSKGRLGSRSLSETALVPWSRARPGGSHSVVGPGQVPDAYSHRLAIKPLVIDLGSTWRHPAIHPGAKPLLYG
ncbi:unnamed protein product [Polarella glacialis]|uniref:C2 domain-containing protein n=1 Tax=Polarella glacialis TaxID=89957 RepID=A0A813LC89_POLGL|nr:unnamed protein product [Polarella glacialis]